MIERLVQKDLAVKIAAVILALLMWSYATGLENPLTTKQFSIDIKLEEPEGKFLMQPKGPVRVVVTLKGLTHSLERLRSEQIKLGLDKVGLDLSNAPNGTTTFTIEYLSSLAGIEVIDINPGTLSVELVPRDSKQVGIEVVTRGTPNTEFIADKPAYAETKVTVTGPRNNVERVQIVHGEIDVTGAVSLTAGKVELVPKDAMGNEIAQVTVEPAEIEVTVPMNQRDPANRVPVKVDVTGTPKTGYKVAGSTTSPDYVEIRGDASVISKIKSISTRPVDISGRESGYSIGVPLVIPSGVTEIEVNRVTASVDIQPDIVTKAFPNVPVQVKDPPIGFSWDIEPSQVTVELEGRSDIIAQVKAADVQAFINAGDITAEDVGLKREFSRIVSLGDLPAGVSIKKPNDPKVTLILTKR